MAGWRESEAGKQDVQIDMVYAAERSVDWKAFEGATEQLELDEAWLFVTRLISRESFKKRYPVTHRRLAKSKKVKPVFFPKRVMNSRGRYYHNESEHLGGVAGGEVTNSIHNGASDVYNWKADRKRYRPTGLRIYPHNYGGWASKDEMALAKYARQRWVIIHELAHVVDSNENGRQEEAYHQGHGWQFCAIYLRLVRMAFGKEAQVALRAAFKEGHVKYLEPRGAKNIHPWDPHPEGWVY